MLSYSFVNRKTLHTTTVIDCRSSSLCCLDRYLHILFPLTASLILLLLGVSSDSGLWDCTPQIQKVSPGNSLHVCDVRERRYERDEEDKFSKSHPWLIHHLCGRFVSLKIRWWFTVLKLFLGTPQVDNVFAVPVIDTYVQREDDWMQVVLILP